VQLTEERLGELALDMTLSADPNLRNEDARRILADRRPRFLPDLVEMLTETGELPFELRQLGPHPFPRNVQAGNLHDFLRACLVGIARFGVSRRPPVPAGLPAGVQRAAVLNVTLEDRAAAGQDPRDVLRLARLGFLQSQQGVRQVQETWDIPFSEKSTKDFHAHVEAALEILAKLEESCDGGYRALQATAIAHDGVRRAMELLGAAGHGYTHHGHLLTGIVLEIAGQTERTVGTPGDIDGARVSAVRKALYRGRELRPFVTS